MTKIKVYVEESELYPYYICRDPPPKYATDEDIFEVDLETMERWKEAKNNFFIAQQEIIAAFRRYENECAFNKLSAEEQMLLRLRRGESVLFNGVKIIRPERIILKPGDIVFGVLKNNLGLYTVKEVHGKRTLKYFVGIGADGGMSGWLSESRVLGVPEGNENAES